MISQSAPWSHATSSHKRFILLTEVSAIAGGKGLASCAVPSLADGARASPGLLLGNDVISSEH